jgi:hypothetical protein
VNYLQLCQRTATECGVASGSSITSALPTVIGATGSLARIVNWVATAWTELQMAHEDWIWMRSSNILGKGVSFQTIAGQASYPIGVGPGTVGIAWADFGKWDEEAFRNQTTTEGYLDEIFMDNIPYDSWRDSYMLGAMRGVKTRPVAIAVGPNQSLNLGPPPDAEYTITGDYFVAPQELALDTDVPLHIPSRFHMLIVYRAMIEYGGYEAATEVTQRGIDKNARMYAQLLSVRAPRMVMGGALA